MSDNDLTAHEFDEAKQAKAKSAYCHHIEDAFVLRLTGEDRQNWFHNFCTADIKNLEAGHGCEAFILGIKGKTIAHCVVLASKYDLTLIVVGEPSECLEEHFNKYIITEKVIIERLLHQHLWYVHGDTLNRLMEKIGNDESPTYKHGLIRDRTIGVVAKISGKLDWFLLVGGDQDVAMWYGGIDKMADDEFNRIRIRGEWPVCGSDVSTSNLPQEFQRDQQAISFDKGCYLGQETVARIDALGHVNYFFVGMQFDGDVKAAGKELSKDDKSVGRVTSSVFDPKTGKTLAVGFVRRLQAKPDATFDSEVGVATLVH